jgi:hypothetical protein
MCEKVLPWDCACRCFCDTCCTDHSIRGRYGIDDAEEKCDYSLILANILRSLSVDAQCLRDDHRILGIPKQVILVFSNLHRAATIL